MVDAAIRCPDCAGTCIVPTPDDACVFFHRCECCGTWLRAVEGDCCVVCSYGRTLCPPRRAEEGSRED